VSEFLNGRSANYSAIQWHETVDSGKASGGRAVIHSSDGHTLAASTQMVAVAVSTEMLACCVQEAQLSQKKNHAESGSKHPSKIFPNSKLHTTVD